MHSKDPLADQADGARAIDPNVSFLLPGQLFFLAVRQDLLFRCGMMDLRHIPDERALSGRMLKQIDEIFLFRVKPFGAIAYDRCYAPFFCSSPKV